ncbi:MAG: lytic transglycosylase domain-containing protein [Bacteroidales bacterium]|jgi:hypothetical protein|nr:lytic transglycosylase domain-containing protein [Bacteroidales bacterium]
MKKGLFFSAGIVVGILCMISIFAVVDINTPDQDYKTMFYRNTKVLAPELPMTADFSGEEVPLNLYYVREAFDREIMASTFMHSSSIMMFKRANRWFPVIEPILKKNGIPDDFKFLVLAESNLSNVVSPAGAEGYWQFMKVTGQKYGLEINEFVDERYNMQKATEAACTYFKDAYHTFKNYTVTAASYNRGMDGVGKAIEKQYAHGFYDLFLNEETSRYIYRILAIKEVYNHPVRYGFYLRERDFYPPIPTRNMTIDSAITNLPTFAQKISVSYRVLRELNPWIQNYSLPNKSRKTYTFIVPMEGALNTDMLLKKIPASKTFFHDTLKLNEIN